MKATEPESTRLGRRRALWTTAAVTVASSIILLVLAPQVLAQNRSRESERAIAILRDVFDFVGRNYVDAASADTETLLEGALAGMLEAVEDPYTTFIDSDHIDGLNDLSTGEFGGVGLHIREVEDGVIVVAPIEDSPAAKAGITAGDLIVGIDGEYAADLDSAGVVSRLRGSPGTDVSVSLLREGNVRLEVTVTRELIEVPTVRHALIDSEIGYMRVSQFTSKTPNRMREALADLEGRSRSLIIDLRGNPGGLLSAVVDVVDLFLDSGTIVTTRSRVRSENEEYTATRRATVVDADVPIIVLIDNASASASEILAGALKDQERAYLIGEQSFGKGSVQQVKRIEGDRAVKVTTARYYTPGGIKIDQVGVQPHRVTEPELSKAEEDELSELGSSELLREFALDNPEPADSDVQRLLQEVAEADYQLDEQLIRRQLVRAIAWVHPQAPIYDLDYDASVIEAVRLLRTGEVTADSFPDDPEPAAAASANREVTHSLDGVHIELPGTAPAGRPSVD